MLWVGQVNHPTRQDKANWRSTSRAGDKIPYAVVHMAHFSESDTVSAYTEEDIWKVCALQADGSKIKTRPNAYRVEVSKPKKLEKMTELFEHPFYQF
jgi:hypothetical protein